MGGASTYIPYVNGQGVAVNSFTPTQLQAERLPSVLCKLSEKTRTAHFIPKIGYVLAFVDYHKWQENSFDLAEKH